MHACTNTIDLKNPIGQRAVNPGLASNLSLLIETNVTNHFNRLNGPANNLDGPKARVTMMHFTEGGVRICSCSGLAMED